MVPRVCKWFLEGDLSITYFYKKSSKMGGASKLRERTPEWGMLLPIYPYWLGILSFLGCNWSFYGRDTTHLLTEGQFFLTWHSFLHRNHKLSPSRNAIGKTWFWPWIRNTTSLGMSLLGSITMNILTSVWGRRVDDFSILITFPKGSKACGMRLLRNGRRLLIVFHLVEVHPKSFHLWHPRTMGLP